MKKLSLTEQLKKLDEMKDEDIDFSEIPELDLDSMREVDFEIPTKTRITIRLDNRVVDWFKASGGGYQTNINKVLNSYIDSIENRPRP